MLIASGYVAQVDAESCIGCGACAERCPFNAIQLADDLSQIDGQACMGCGICVRGCPEGVLSLVRDPSRPAPLELEEIRATG